MQNPPAIHVQRELDERAETMHQWLQAVVTVPWPLIDARNRERLAKLHGLLQSAGVDLESWAR